VGKKAKAILVFPRIIKGGFIVGAQHGDGALIVKKGIYVFFFSQKGLMGGLGLHGTKITQHTPSA
jgi:lipid-binding SYLF domain-containing protein